MNWKLFKMRFNYTICYYQQSACDVDLKCSRKFVGVDLRESEKWVAPQPKTYLYHIFRLKLPFGIYLI